MPQCLVPTQRGCLSFREKAKTREISLMDAVTKYLGVQPKVLGLVPPNEDSTNGREKVTTTSLLRAG